MLQKRVRRAYPDILNNLSPISFKEAAALNGLLGDTPIFHALAHYFGIPADLLELLQQSSFSVYNLSLIHI